MPIDLAGETRFDVYLVRENWEQVVNVQLPQVVRRVLPSRNVFGTVRDTAGFAAAPGLLSLRSTLGRQPARKVSAGTGSTASFLQALSGFETVNVNPGGFPHRDVLSSSRPGDRGAPDEDARGQRPRHDMASFRGRFERRPDVRFPGGLRSEAVSESADQHDGGERSDLLQMWQAARGRPAMRRPGADAQPASVPMRVIRDGCRRKPRARERAWAGDLVPRGWCFRSTP